VENTLTLTGGGESSDAEYGDDSCLNAGGGGGSDTGFSAARIMVLLTKLYAALGRKKHERAMGDTKNDSLELR
jgi:hypothetical protein